MFSTSVPFNPARMEEPVPLKNPESASPANTSEGAATEPFATVVMPATARVDDSVVAPVTPRVDESVVAPVTASVDRSVVAPVTPRVEERVPVVPAIELPLIKTAPAVPMLIANAAVTPVP